MTVTSWEKQVLVKGLIVTIGVVLCGLNGPWLFQRFGLNVPSAAAAGIVTGAAIAYGCADAWVRSQSRGHVITNVPEITKPVVSAGADDLRTEPNADPSADAIRQRIRAGLARLEADGGQVQVEVRNSKVVLKGTVHSWAGEAEAERIAFDMPGIQEVDNRIEVAMAPAART